MRISLDSLGPAKHDRFRGVSGAWEGAVHGARACVARDPPLLLQMTVSPWNHCQVIGVTELASREGVNKRTL